MVQEEDLPPLADSFLLQMFYILLTIPSLLTCKCFTFMLSFLCAMALRPANAERLFAPARLNFIRFQDSRPGQNFVIGEMLHTWRVWVCTSGHLPCAG